MTPPSVASISQSNCYNAGMATLTIRKLDEAVHERLRARALANNRSLEAEVRHLLEESTREKLDLARELESFHRQMVAKHGLLPDSTELIRELRRSP